MIYGPSHFYNEAEDRAIKFRGARLKQYMPPRPSQPLPLAPKEVPRNARPLHQILAAAAIVTHTTYNDLVSPKRFKDFVRARFVYYAVAAETTVCSLVQIGKHCGDRDHSTVLHGLSVVEARRAEFQPAIDAVKKMIEGAT